MGYPLPAENYRGYQEGSLIDRAKNIRGKAFLLAHGMADRNVHFQNSILLAKALVNHNIPFEQHVSVFSTQKLISPSFFLGFANYGHPH
jgi:dipeptidyl aminopeptidase/acylaminoacyl peptidase